MDIPTDLEQWRLNWIAANDRTFYGGEMLTELLAAINTALAALGRPPIRPPTGRCRLDQLLAKIPKDIYANVVEVLCTNGNQSNSNNINNNNKRQHPGVEAQVGSPKKIRLGDIAEHPKDVNGTEIGHTMNNIVPVGSPPCKRKPDDLPVLPRVKATKMTAESCSGGGDPEAAERTTRDNPVRAIRNITATLTFPPAVCYFSDIFSEHSTFLSDTRAQEFAAKVKLYYPHSLSSLKGQSSKNKVQCVILNKDEVGFAAATFVLRDSSPLKLSALVVTLPS